MLLQPVHPERLQECAGLQEAISLGIPKAALPKLSEETSVEELQDARVRLSGMIASFMSSGL